MQAYISSAAVVLARDAEINPEMVIAETGAAVLRTKELQTSR